jgi:hypothetical protein
MKLRETVEHQDLRRQLGVRLQWRVLYLARSHPRQQYID